MPRGVPVHDLRDRKKTPATFPLLVGVMIAAHASSYVLPLIVMAATGAWKAGLTYFLPIMAQLVVNIAVEKTCSQSGGTLAVFASTPLNSLSRLALALAALYDMSRLATPPHQALWLVSLLQVVVNVAVPLLIVPAAMSYMPLVPEEEEGAPAKAIAA